MTKYKEEQLSIKEVNKEKHVTLEDRYIYQYPIIMRYLQGMLEGKSVVDFFTKEKINSIALYAVTEFTELIVKDIRNYDSVRIAAISDKNARKYGIEFLKIPMCDKNDMLEMYRKGEIEKVIVCSMFHEAEIRNELLCGGIDIDDLLSVKEIIYYM